ncbi:hypothetical protein C4565_09245 [Candidatus Parcubacteria bacterium]|nr:MAG: hypothetical protein C4565_09245 [Candidatus Parcubacteria bacterium]
MHNTPVYNKVIVIAPTSSQPRYHKRVSQIAKFYPVDVFAFSRGYYNENTFPGDVRFFGLGKIDDGKYLERIPRFISAILKIRSHLVKKRSLFYAMSFDCMLIARLCGIKRGFYEIGDLRQAEGFGKSLSWFERFLLRSISGLVLTSEYFYEDFYKKKDLLPEEKVFVIDNKVNQALARKRPGKKVFSQKRIIIGLVGLLRYQRPIELLLDFVQSQGDYFIVECFGDGPLRGLIESRQCENIRYHGSFRNPHDIPVIYEQIDLNYVVYDASSTNVRLAIPNKLFESAFFGVPIVCCAGTAVGKKACEWGIGKMVRIDSRRNFELDLSTIDRPWIAACTKNCFGIPDSELIDNGEQIVQRMLRQVGNM